MNTRAKRVARLGLLGAGLWAGASAGCTDPGVATCEAGQFGCECVQGLCIGELQCIGGLCLGGDPGETGEDSETDSSGDGDGDGGGDGDGDGDDPVPGEDCPGVPIDNDGALDLDLEVVHVDGELTLDGQTMPDWSSSRGTIYFDNLEQGTVAAFDIGSAGAALYELALPVGTYEVSFVGNSAACSVDPSPGFPCNRDLLLPSIELVNDGGLDLDTSAVTIAGTVTLNGEALPSATTSRGQLGFYSATHQLAFTEGFGSEGAANYSITIAPGSYSIRWIGNSSTCDDDPAPSIPCNTGTVLDGVALTQSGSVDVDVPSVTVGGSVTINGEAMPAEPLERGHLSFANDLLPVDTGNFGASGAASYTLTLVAGDYDVVWNGNEALCSEPSAVPCNDARVLADLSLMQSGALDVDVGAARVDGSVTVNGAQMGNESGSRGALSFTGSDGHVVLTEDFEMVGPASYALTVVTGVYDVGLAGNPGLCDGVDVVGVPCMSGRLLQGVVLGQDGLLDVDISTARITGVVTVEGQPLPSWTSSRGRLSFTSADGSGQGLSNSFGTNGPGDYEVTLIAGTYDIGWRAGAQLCADGAAPLPCVDGPVYTGVPLEFDGAVDVELGLVTVSGAVLLEGATLPNEAASRGQLSFRNVNGGLVMLPPFDSIGAASYAISLLPGNYVVSHLAEAIACNDDTQLPCASQVLLGCE